MTERRLEKTASVICDFVSRLFVTRVSDPRLRTLNVTRAKVSPDMRRAYVYYSVMGGEEAEAEAARALRKAAGFVRASLAGGLSLRFTPEVVFIFDKNPAYAQRVMEILATDPSVAALRAGTPASPAKGQAGGATGAEGQGGAGADSVVGVGGHEDSVDGDSVGGDDDYGDSVGGDDDYGDADADADNGYPDSDDADGGVDIEGDS
ncbi:MAG: 30S ribosome-binding factor RbfA [Deltaproteobacteria bacterium]|jgi:ribosome-binding factor A|nr:30S ribosome-binding factor RbfA [Deltaproteobacteria bacterium]